MTGDVVTWGSIAIALGSLLTILKFWGSYSDRIVRAEAAATAAATAANAAAAAAAAATANAREANEKVTLLSASFGIYREQIAREYIHREVMHEVEERMTSAIDRLGDRLDRVLERSENSPQHWPPRG